MMYSKLGHVCHFNGNDIFVESDTRLVTDALVVRFINAYQNMTNSFWNIDSDVINYFKKRIEYATYDLRITENGFRYNHIETKNGTINAPLDDKNVIIILKLK